MKVLCFDTETTGLWKNPKAQITDDKNWPHIVQLAWILLDMETGRVISSNSFIIKMANDQKIPVESTKIHGITNEDMDLYGINCVHYGAPKTWYCVPPKFGHLLEKVCTELYPQDAQVCSGFMRHKTCLVGPHILEKHGVPFQTVVQEAREIIIGI